MIDLEQISRFLSTTFKAQLSQSATWDPPMRSSCFFLVCRGWKPKAAMPFMCSSHHASSLSLLWSQGKDKSCESLLHNSSTPHELDCFWESSNLPCGRGRICNRRWTLIAVIVPGLLLAYIWIFRPGLSHYHSCISMAIDRDSLHEEFGILSAPVCLGLYTCTTYFRH